VNESILSALVGVAAINGILGSLAFPYLRNCCGLEIAGQVGLTTLLIPLSASIVALFLPGSPWTWHAHQDKDMDQHCPTKLSIYVLLAGVVVSRFGLWLTDVAVTQIQQEEVEEEIRGAIGGVQGSLNSCLDLLKYVLVLFLPEAADFGYLAFASYGCILCGAILYTSYAIPKVYCPTWKSRRFHGSEVIPLLRSTASPPSMPDTPSPQTLDGYPMS